MTATMAIGASAAEYLEAKIKKLQGPILYPLSYWSQLVPLPGKLRGLTLDLLRASGAGKLAIPLPAGNIWAVGFK